jgi:hypothetical protein
MKARTAAIFAMACLAALVLVTPASASFGFEDQDVTFTNKDGSPAIQAGSHPFAMTTIFHFNTRNDPQLGVIPDGSLKEVVADLPSGFAVDPNAVPHCSNADFSAVIFGTLSVKCPDDTALGVFGLLKSGKNVSSELTPVYNLVPPPGVASKLGFRVGNVSAVIEGGVRDGGERNLYATVGGASQAELIYGSTLTLWGNPADPAHDGERGNCAIQGGSCPISTTERAFITLPRSCSGPLRTIFQIDSWQNPTEWVRAESETHDNAVPPNPLGMSGCGKLGFNPSITAQPTTKAAQSPTGLDFSLDVHDEGLTSPTGIANSDIKKAVVTLPEGFSTNPSIAEGLSVCSEGDLQRESAFSSPGAGCPNASKIGTVEVETPLLDEGVNGSLFVAKPYENPFGSLLALYMVIKNPVLGIVVKQPLKVEPNPVSGRLVTIADNLPQLPFSHFKLHFREGTRAPLASPSGCGTYNAEAVLTPTSGGAPITTNSAFQIVTGPGAGACPSGAQRFRPGLEAGTLSNAAGRYSPFYLRLTRNDGEQEFSRFSVKLPPGLVGKLAGIPFCPDAAIAVARARTGPNGGQEELSQPSCPVTSEIGHTSVGAGVGPSLAYAPGKIYLAGPYRGSSLSIVAITAAKVGPFDLGTVVIREALRVNPETAEVVIDAAGSDPIPHIIKGIPVHARDIRAYVDRSNFVLNPTSCKPMSTASTVLGSGLDFSSAADDQAFTATSPFQAADCASLGFKPKLALSLKGGTARGDNPALKAVLTYPAKGYYANVSRAQVTLPHSEFLEQGHIKTICTRVQFAQGAVPGEKCPAGAVYGSARATTPLLDEPLKGPVFLRSSSHPLPDLVVVLHSRRIDIAVVGRIDSVKGGRIRTTFESVPDAPVSKFILEMQGGKKGLLVNSTNICRRQNRALAAFSGQNGRQHNFGPALRASCGAK